MQSNDSNEDESVLYWPLMTGDDMTCDINNSYNISEIDAERYIFPRGQTVLITIFLPIIFVIGMLSNVAFIYVTVRIKHMRTVTNKYLVNLAASDVIFLAAAIGHKLWKFTNSPVMGDDSSLGSLGCIWVYFMSDMAYFASIIFVTIVSLDRYLAVCQPQNRNNIIKGKSTEICIVSWVCSCIIAGALIPSNSSFLPYCMLWPDIAKFRNWPKVIGFCFPVQPWIGDFATGVQTVPFFLTFVINSYLYVAIIKGLDECIKRMNKHGVSKSKDSGMRRQIARMLVVNGVTFFILLAPFELGSLFQLIASLRGQDEYVFLITNDKIRSYLMLTARAMSYINAAVNPIIYTAMCRRYLQAFKYAFLPISCRQPDKNTPSRGVSAVPTQTEVTKLNQDYSDTNV